MTDLIDDGDEPIDAEVVEAPADAPPPVDPEVEAKARRAGWRPPHESNLPQNRQLSAEEYLGTSKAQIRLLRDDLTERDRRIEAAEATLRETAASVRRQERARYESELADIRAGKEAAVESADVEAYRALNEREARMRPPAEAPAKNPWVAAYEETDEGKWLKDPQLAAFGSAALGSDPLAQRMPVEEQVAWAKEKVKQYFPAKFKEAPPQPRDDGGRYASSRVDGGGLATGRSPAGNGLSSEDHAAAVRLVSRGTFKDVGEYAAYVKKMGVVE